MLLLKSLLAAATVGFVYSQTNDAEPACWEETFVENDEDDLIYRDLWDKVAEVALEIKLLKNIYNVEKIGFLMDSSVSKHHNVATDFDSDVTEAEMIFQIQFFLNLLLNRMSHDDNAYHVQYNEESAWGCESFQCTDLCDQPCFTQVEVGPTSHCEGNVEAGCRLLNDYMNTIDCDVDSDSTKMVIAITNGDFYLNTDFFRHRGHQGSSSSSSEERCPSHHWFHGHSSTEDHFSPCMSYFDTRYVIGVHSPTDKVMRQLVSKHANYRYFSANEFTYNGLNRLLNDIDSDCCSNGRAAQVQERAAPNYPCSKTQGPFGELIEDFGTHPWATQTGAQCVDDLIAG